MDIAAIATKELQQLESDMKILRREMADIQHREQHIQREIDAWKTILEARSGETTALIPSRGANAIAPMTVGDFHFTDPATNKTDVVRLVFQEAGIRGLVASDLVEKLKEAGVGGHRSFPYTAISKMKGRGEIFEADGRYFWAQTNLLEEEVKDQEAAEAAS
jgi:hypothetical protein